MIEYKDDKLSLKVAKKLPYADELHLTAKNAQDLIDTSMCVHYEYDIYKINTSNIKLDSNGFFEIEYYDEIQHKTMDDAAERICGLEKYLFAQLVIKTNGNYEEKLDPDVYRYPKVYDDNTIVITNVMPYIDSIDSMLMDIDPANGGIDIEIKSRCPWINYENDGAEYEVNQNLWRFREDWYPKNTIFK